jgi:hypothetical protein
MSRIVAGRFDTSMDADAALGELPRAGFRSGEFESFYVSPPGQHGKHPLGGDAHSDAGARRAGWGGAVGAAIGAAVGLVVGTLVSDHYGVIVVLLAAGLGAYIGSFIGGMVQTRGASPHEGTREHPAEPAAGRMVAVNVDRPEMQTRAIEVLRRHHARDIGRTQGEWRDGSWRDFDPRSPLGAV